MADKAGSIAVEFTALGYTVGGHGQYVLKEGGEGYYFMGLAGRDREMTVRFDSPDDAKAFDQSGLGIKTPLFPVTIKFDPV